MKKYLALIVVVILTFNTTSFRASSHGENLVSENITALATFEQKLGQTCTMGCQRVEFFYVCVICGNQPTDPCYSFHFFDEGIGYRSTCGAEN